MAWEVRKLKEICEIELGKTPSRSNKKYWDNDKQTKNIWLSIADLLNTNGRIVDESKEYISNEGAKVSKIVKKGTLLVSFKLTLGRLAFAGKDLFTNEAIAALTIMNENKLCKEYLYYYLSFFDWNKATEGDIKVKGKTLNKAKLKEIDIPVPPLPIQKKIVKVLDSAFEKIAKAKENSEKNLQNAKDIFEGHLKSIFENKGEDWEEKRFDQICVLQRGFDLPTKQRKTGKFPLVSSNGITDYIDTFKVKAPGVVTGRSGTIGNVHFIEEDFWPLNTSLYIKDFHGNSEKFVFYFLKFFDLSKYSSGAGVPTLNRNNVHCEKTSFPKIKHKQVELANKIDELLLLTNALSPIYERKILILEELKQSILQKAFKGELTEALS